MNDTIIIHRIQEAASNSGTYSLQAQLASQNRCQRRRFDILSKGLNKIQRAALRYKMFAKNQFWMQVERLLKKLTPLKRLLADHIIKLYFAFGRITQSGISIAEHFGCNKGTVYEVFKEFQLNGLMPTNKRRSNKRFPNRSNLRILHPVLHCLELKIRLWKLYDSYRKYFLKANIKLKLWIIFQKEPSRILSNFNISRFSKSDIQLYENIDTHIREVELPMVPITEFLRNDVTKTLHLTKKGQLYLSAFSDEALKHAIEGLRHLGNNSQKDNFKLFLNLCYNYSHEYRLTVQTERADDLIREYGCKEFGPYYFETSMQLLIAPKITSQAAPQSKPPMTKSNNPRTIDLHPLFRDETIALTLRLGYEDKLNFNEDA